MDWKLFISLRYLTSKHKEKFISLISAISVAGVTVGVAALIIVLAVMSGFDYDLKEKIIGTYAHIEILNDFGMRPSGELAGRVLAAPHVTAVTFFLNGQALVRFGDTVIGVVVKGIRPETEVRVGKLGAYLQKGSLALTGGKAVIGSELAARLHAHIGSEITLASPAFVEGRKFTVGGIFASGMYEYDMNLVYIDINDAQKLFGSEGLVSGMAVRVDDALHVPAAQAALRKEVGPPFVVRTWMDLNRNLLSALKLEKTVMFIILTLIVMVACFNIAGTLIMTVLEKTKDIGILKAIGASNDAVMKLFALQGIMVGAIGTFVGAAAGLGISWCLKTYQFIALPKDVYYIDKLPVRIEPFDIAVIVVSSMLLSFVAAVYPAYKASRLDPVEALRYE